MSTFPVTTFESLMDNTCTTGKIRIRQLIELASVNGNITVDAKLVGQYICLDEWADLNELVEWINDGFTRDCEIDQAMRFAIIDFIADMEDDESFDLPVCSGRYDADLAAINYAIEKGLVQNVLYMYVRAGTIRDANWPGLLKNLFDGDINVTDLMAVFDEYGERVWVIASERVPTSTQKDAMYQMNCQVAEIVQYVGFDNLTRDELMVLPVEQARNIIAYGKNLSLDDYYVLFDNLNAELGTLFVHHRQIHGRMFPAGHRAVITDMTETNSRRIGNVEITWSPVVLGGGGVSILSGAEFVLAITEDGLLFNRPTVVCQVTELPRVGDPDVLYYVQAYSQTFDGFIKQWIAANPECQLVLDTPMADTTVPHYTLRVEKGEIRISQR